MADGLFQNGNRRITRLVIYELASACLLMVIIGVQAMLPAQDWMSPKALKVTMFILGIAGLLLKSIEMFFNKTATLFQNGAQTGDTAFIQKPQDTK